MQSSRTLYITVIALHIHVYVHTKCLNFLMLVLNVHLLLIYTFTDFVDHCGGRYFVGVSAFVKVQLKVSVMMIRNAEENIKIVTNNINRYTKDVLLKVQVKGNK